MREVSSRMSINWKVSFSAHHTTTIYLLQNYLLKTKVKKNAAFKNCKYDMVGQGTLRKVSDYGQFQWFQYLLCCSLLIKSNYPLLFPTYILSLSRYDQVVFRRPGSFSLEDQKRYFAQIILEKLDLFIKTKISDRILLFRQKHNNFP